MLFKASHLALLSITFLNVKALDISDSIDSIDESTFSEFTVSDCCCPQKLTMAVWESAPYFHQFTQGLNQSSGIFQVIVKSLIDFGCSISKCNGKKGVQEIIIKQVKSHEYGLKLVKTNESFLSFPIPVDDGEAADGSVFTVVYSTGVAVIVKHASPKASKVILDCLGDSWSLFMLTVSMAAMAGIIIWFLDHRGNEDEFPKDFIRGSWEGFWWAFITMTTVGYGDKTPKTILGRAFAVMWTLFGLVLVCILMATVTNALTSQTIERQRPEIKTKRIAALHGGIEYKVGIEQGARMRGMATIKELFAALNSPSIDGILLDERMATHQLNQINDPSIEILSIIQRPFSFGMAISDYVPHQNQEDLKCFFRMCEYYTQSGHFDKDLEVFESQIMDTVFDTKAKTYNIFEEEKTNILIISGIILAIVAVLYLFGFIYKRTMKKQNSENRVIEIQTNKPGALALVEYDHKTQHELLLEIIKLHIDGESRMKDMSCKLDALEKRIKGI